MAFEYDKKKARNMILVLGITGFGRSIFMFLSVVFYAYIYFTGSTQTKQIIGAVLMLTWIVCHIIRKIQLAAIERSS